MTDSAVAIRRAFRDPEARVRGETGVTGQARICITAKPGDLTEGLFGGVFLQTFEVLPALQQYGIYPNWQIASRLYGNEPDYLVIPGVLDLSYASGAGKTKSVSLRNIRRKYKFTLGSDWKALGELWGSYFKIPERIEKRADDVGDLTNVLGIHYRGQDKVLATWDSNPVSHDDFVTIVKDFLGRDRRFSKLYVATDDRGFVEHIRSAIDLEVVNLGEGKSHKVLENHSGRFAEAERALLDCVILSKCGAVLNTSSALSAFAKILRPDLEIYRCAASKLFSSAPYFPIAYIPIYESENSNVQNILSRTLHDDWTHNINGAKFLPLFAFRKLPFGKSTAFVSTFSARSRSFLKELLLIFWPGLRPARAMQTDRLN